MVFFKIITKIFLKVKRDAQAPRYFFSWTDPVRMSERGFWE